MLFNTRTFSVFLVLVLLVYYRLPHQGRLNFLLGASFAFYGWGDPRLCLLVGAAILVGWGTAVAIDRARTVARRRAWFALALTANLGALLFFKYWDFGVRSVGFWSGVAGWPVDVSSLRLDVLLPIGISFYTFQIVSYSIDVYLGRFRATSSLRDFALYVMFFPQLVAGPVERASHLLPQYARPFSLGRDQVIDGVFLILLGYVKKSVLGDRISGWIAPAFADGPENGFVAWASVLLFTTQIYVDFSAYSDIAIGTARLLGFDIRPNFDFPFVVPSITERWRRWHISMGHWFRDYVYFPLGGNRHGPLRAQINLMIVMFLSGLWHGASYNFVVWGLLNGAAMVLHRLLEPGVLRPLARIFDRHPATRWGWYYLCCTVTMLMVSAINIFFRSDTWPVAKRFVSAMFLHPVALWESLGDALPRGYPDGFVFMALVIVAHEVERHFRVRDRVAARPWSWAVICAVMFVVVLLFAVKGGRFIYYQF